jgi:hypothetical protein
VVGGKAIGSWIPYTIIGFEVMVLVGALSTVFGMFLPLAHPAPDPPRSATIRASATAVRRVGGVPAGQASDRGGRAAPARRRGGPR